MRLKGHVKGKWAATEQSLDPQTPLHSHSAARIHGSGADTLNGHTVWKVIQGLNFLYKKKKKGNRNIITLLPS